MNNEILTMENDCEEFVIIEPSSKEIVTFEENTGGTSNYNYLTNKPQINGVLLEGNKTSEDLRIKQIYTANDISFTDGETFQQKYDNGELKGGKGDPGINGQNGFSPTITATPIENGTKVDITDVNGVKSFEVLNGKDGKQGLKGEPGEQGNPGTDGADGKTPVKGVDYFTEQDKQEFIEEVEQALTPQFNNKLDKNQGTENNGKFLGIGADGLVVPKDVPSTGGGETKNPIVIADVTINGEGITSVAEDIDNIDNIYSVCIIITAPSEADWAVNNMWINLGKAQVGHLNVITISKGKSFVIQAERYVDVTSCIAYNNASYMWLNKTLYATITKNTWEGATSLSITSGGIPAGTNIKVVGK